MLEKLPSALGHALERVRAGFDKIASEDETMRAPGGLILGSPAFVEGGALPASCTADGAGVSPPLTWSGVPTAAMTLALIVEDADSPTPEPIVHALAWGLSLNGELVEGALNGDGSGGVVTGRNSYRKRGWLPPDPPSGHGPHRYVFQLYALSAAPGIDGAPGKGDFLDAIRPLLLAGGRLTGTYERS